MCDDGQVSLVLAGLSTPHEFWTSDNSATGASRGALTESRRSHSSTTVQHTWAPCPAGTGFPVHIRPLHCPVLLSAETAQPTATNSLRPLMSPIRHEFPLLHHFEPASGSVTFPSPWWVALGAQDDLECRRAQAVVRGLQQRCSRGASELLLWHATCPQANPGRLCVIGLLFRTRGAAYIVCMKTCA